MRTRIRIRASSLSTWLDCAYRAACDNPDIYAKPMLPASARAWTGTSVHRATALFDQAVHIEQQDMRSGDAVDAFVEAMNRPDEPVDWGDEKRPKLESVGIKLVKQYTEIISPKSAFEAVEATCNPFVVTFEDLGLEIELTGTLDRRYLTLAEGNAVKRGIGDLKSGIQAVASDGTAKTKGFECQMGAYEVLDEFTNGMPLEADAIIIGLSTSGQGRIGAGTVSNAKDALFGTEEFPGQIEHIAKMIKYEAFPGNPRSMMCHEKYCSQHEVCPYRAR